MDLNRLYFDHQLLLMKAARTPWSDARAIDASHLAGRIGCILRANGAAAAPAWEALAAYDEISLAPPATQSAGQLS